MHTTGPALGPFFQRPLEPHQILLGILLAALFLRLCAGALDLGRIDEFAQDRGWTVRRKSWAPFGPGWFGEQNARIYRIEYEDADGHLHLAHVKTSMFSGVYVREDQVIRRAEGSSDPLAASPDEADRIQALEAENAALRQRLAELEAGAVDLPQ